MYDKGRLPFQSAQQSFHAAQNSAQLHLEKAKKTDDLSNGALVTQDEGEFVNKVTLHFTKILLHF